MKETENSKIIGEWEVKVTSFIGDTKFPENPVKLDYSPFFNWFSLSSLKIDPNEARYPFIFYLRLL